MKKEKIRPLSVGDTVWCHSLYDDGQYTLEKIVKEGTKYWTLDNGVKVDKYTGQAFHDGYGYRREIFLSTEDMLDTRYLRKHVHSTSSAVKDLERAKAVGKSAELLRQIRSLLALEDT